MIITATEFKKNMAKYLSTAAKEDILITKNGKHVARLTGATRNKVDIVNSLTGIIPDEGLTREKIREKRLARYESDSD